MPQIFDFIPTKNITLSYHTKSFACKYLYLSIILTNK